jgi:hypothetical protein
MAHQWILDVLADLKVYARRNDLTALAEYLEDARHIAVEELASGAAGSQAASTGDGPDRSSHAKRFGGAL